MSLQFVDNGFGGYRKVKDLSCDATLAQLVERNLAQVEVTSSNLVCRSNFIALIVLNNEIRTRGGAAW